MARKEKNKKASETRKEELIDDTFEGENEEGKKQSKIVQSFNLYKFILKLIAAVLLLVFGIVILVEQKWAIFALLFVTGGVAAISSLVRLCLLLKSGKCSQSKKISLVEGLIILLLGGYLVAAAFMYKKDPESTISVFNEKYYGIFIAVILYVKAVAYFWEQVIYKEKTTKFMFWLHIGFITTAVLFAAIADKIRPQYIVIVLASIALICALLIGGEAATGYFKYRKFLHPKKEKSKEKEITKEDSSSIDAPARDEEKIIEEINPAIIPENDTPKDDSLVI